METLTLQKEIKVFGFQVRDCPDGIGEAFKILVQRMESSFRRPYYGISEVKDGRFFYKATAGELYAGEGKDYGCEEYVIEKGVYLAVVVHEWRKRTESIKDVYHGMMQDGRVDCSKPFVEWYKDDDEMICMVRIS